MTPQLKNVLVAAAVVAAAAEGVVIYRQWPSPPLKVCASVELGELLAASAKSEAQLHEARARLRSDPDEAATKDVMRVESESAAALIAVARYKQQAQEKQKAAGATAREGSCA